MDSAPVLTATSAAEILGYIPHALGYWPRSSLVVLTMEKRQLRATLRMDLPSWNDNARRDATLCRDFADRAAGALAADKAATHTVAAIYSEDPWGSAGLVPHQRLLSMLSDRLQRTGMPLQLGWIVTPAGWGDYLCAADPSEAGRSLEEIRSSALNTELIYRGSSYAGSLDAAMNLTPTVPPEPDPDIHQWHEHYRGELMGRWLQQNQFLAALSLWQQVLNGAVPAGRGRQTAAVSELGAAPAETPPVPQPGEAPYTSEVTGFLLASLECNNLRDALLVQMSTAPQLAYDGIRACGALEAAGAWAMLPQGIAASDLRRAVRPGRKTVAERDLEDRFCAVLLGTSETGPDWTALNHAWGLLTTLLDDSSGTSSAALLTMLGWIEWHRGRGSRADSLLAEALARVPGYKLAHLLRQLLERGTISGWALNPDTAWRPATNVH